MANIANLLTEHMGIWTAAETEKKSGRGRANGNAGNVYGVKKLRELILELAVRGKLVPQDPSDEPASELLKRIQAAKAKLIAEGKLKKEKLLAPIGEDEKPFELPNGWDYASFGDVVEIVRGITFPGSEKSKSPENGRIACLRTSNVQDQIEWEDILYIKEQFVSREDQFLKPNDIVMSMANSRELVGKVALVGSQIKEKTTFGGFLGVIRPYSILPKFVLTLLRTPLTREALIDNASQTTNIANISLAKLKPLFFAIPPLAEQHCIVAKVDELMALCDQLEQQHSNAQEAHETLVSQLLSTLTQSQNAAEFNANWQRIYAHFDVLFTTEASIDALKQTLLQLAVMGKLVPQDPNDEPASELLKRIQAEKGKLIAAGKLKKEKPLAPIGEDEKPFKLPNGWEWGRIGNLVQNTDYGLSEMTLPMKEGIPVLKMGDIQNGKVILGGQKKVKADVEGLPYLYLKPGDLLYNRTNSAELVGKTGVYEGLENEYTFASYLIRVSCIQQFIFPQFLNIAMNTQSFRETQINPHLKQQCGQANVNGTILKSMVVPVTSLNEQHRIVAKVDALMMLCDQFKTSIHQANQQQQAIADALVAQVLKPSTAEIIDLATYRAAVTCNIIKRMQHNQAFGRTFAMKLLYLSQQHIGFETHLAFEREAAGPFDKWIYDFERDGVAAGWFRLVEKQLSKGYTKIEYQVKSAIEAPLALINSVGSSEQRKELERLLALFMDKKTEEAEIAATLFAAWNDFLLNGVSPTDEKIIQEVLENWHPSKERFSPELLNKWLNWLRDNKIMPTGKGSKTIKIGHQQKLIN